jgi:hypothetical protein
MTTAEIVAYFASKFGQHVSTFAAENVRVQTLATLRTLRAHIADSSI